MPTSDHAVHQQASGFHRCESITLAESTANQLLDTDLLAAASGDEGKRHYISSHIGVLAKKLFEIEERFDRCTLTEKIRSTLVDEVIPDLLVYAAQLAAFTGTSLDDALHRRHVCSGAGLMADALHATRYADDIIMSVDKPPCLAGVEADRVDLLAAQVVSAVRDPDTTDTDLRIRLAAESQRLDFDSSVARAVSNYTVSVRKLRRFAPTCAPIQDVDREIRGVVSREIERSRA